MFIRHNYFQLRLRMRWGQIYLRGRWPVLLLFLSSSPLSFLSTKFLWTDPRFPPPMRVKWCRQETWDISSSWEKMAEIFISIWPLKLFCSSFFVLMCPLSWKKTKTTPTWLCQHGDQLPSWPYLPLQTIADDLLLYLLTGRNQLLREMRPGCHLPSARSTGGEALPQKEASSWPLWFVNMGCTNQIWLVDDINVYLSVTKPTGITPSINNLWINTHTSSV